MHDCVTGTPTGSLRLAPAESTPPEPSQAPALFQWVDSHAVYRPASSASFDEAIGILGHAIAFCNHHGIRKLLINTGGMTGLVTPNIFDRYFCVDQWARAAGGRVRVALVSQLEFIDPDRFIVTVADNRGMIFDSFANEADALQWLLRTESR